MKEREGLILKVDCPDQPGLVARIARYISEFQGSLVEFHQFTDHQKKWFFCRAEIDIANLTVSSQDFISGFRVLGKSLKAQWHFRLLPHRMKTAILVTKTTHCLHEILLRTQMGELPIQITSVIGNKTDCQKITELADIPFIHIDMEIDTENSFRQIAQHLEEQKVELVVLARFMRILPDWLCTQYMGKVINIHHSFLPAFVGAKPYHRAYERGVKLIGATCHYVTEDLDCGPIIEQEVARVQHNHGVQDLIRLGRDCERAALAKGIRHHVQDRIIINDRRAIVFAD